MPALETPTNMYLEFVISIAKGKNRLSEREEGGKCGVGPTLFQGPRKAFLRKEHLSSDLKAQKEPVNEGTSVTRVEWSFHILG